MWHTSRSSCRPPSWLKRFTRSVASSRSTTCGAATARSGICSWHCSSGVFLAWTLQGSLHLQHRLQLVYHSWHGISHEALQVNVQLRLVSRCMCGTSLQA